MSKSKKILGIDPGLARAGYGIVVSSNGNFSAKTYGCIETKKNETFIAKKSNTFEEEKNVVEKAPVNKIEMNDLTNKTLEVKKKILKDNSFILVINEFYYEDSANNLKKELIKKTNMNNISVKKINNKKYRLLVGPFKNFNALKTAYISLNNLGFEDLNIYKD